jgi:hypothetical protein
LYVDKERLSQSYKLFREVRLLEWRFSPVLYQCRKIAVFRTGLLISYFKEIGFVARVPVWLSGFCPSNSQVNTIIALIVGKTPLDQTQFGIWGIFPSE